MDSHLASYAGVIDGDLVLCPDRGVAYQRDMTPKFYGDDYLAKIAAYDPSIAERVNDGRVALLARHSEPGATVLDIGAGDGAFVRRARSWGFDARGFDVIPAAREALFIDGLYDDDPALFDAVAFWDSIEHMDEPGCWLRRVRPGCLLLASIPVFEDLSAIRRSKHYRPGEHLLYFSTDGFVSWMGLHGFCLLESSSHETDAGREGIGAFAFRRAQ